MLLRVVLRDPPREDGKRAIKIRISTTGDVSYIGLRLFIEESNFDKKTQSIKTSAPDGHRLNSIINEKLSRYNKILSQACAEDYSAKRIRELLLSYDADKTRYIHKGTPVGFYLRASKLISSLQQENRTGHASSIMSTVNILRQFHGDDVLYFDQITPDFLRAFKKWYLRRGKEITANKHLRNIKLVFNEARREKEISRDIYPFDIISIPANYDAEVRALDRDDLRKIYKCSGTGRDFFFISFFFCGMNLKDIIEMDHFSESIDVKRIKTRRSVGNVRLKLKIQPEARLILQRYKDPAQRKMVKISSENYRYFNKTINAGLYKIAEQIGIPRFSFAYARHSFATLASELGYPDEIIDRALMHSEGGSMISKYRKFDFSKIDKMMRDVIRAIKSPLRLSDIKKEGL